jgi:hypothetical protein
MLDIACCSSQTRSHFLNLFGHDGMTVSWATIKTDTRNNLFLKWVQQRNIKLSSVFLFAPNNFETKSTLCYPINLLKIKRLIIGGGFDSENDFNFEDIINDCVSLTSLRLHSPSVSDELFSKINCLSQLELIRLSGNTIQLTSKVLAILANSCISLQNLSLELKTSDNIVITNDECFLCDFRTNLTNLLGNNNIRSLELQMIDITDKYLFDHEVDNFLVDSWGLVEIVSSTCPLIEKCKLSFCGALDMSQVASMLLNNKLLKTFRIENSSLYDDFDRVVDFKQSSEISQIFLGEFYDMDYNYNFQNGLGESHIECLFGLTNVFTHIDLDNIEHLSDNLLCLIARKNSQTLVHLSIDANGTIKWSISAIITVLTLCKQLVSLKLNDCAHIANEEFELLYHAPHTLSTFTITNAINLETNTLVNFVVHNFVSCYNSLNYEDCPLIDISKLPLHRRKLLKAALRKKPKCAM